MRPELDATQFIQYNYWDSGHKGLLSGEALLYDLKRLEMAYHDSNKRELEMTRHISLRQLDPLALINLRVTGSCTFTMPEWLFDRDCPGHYMRRIKSVALSFPSVVGPYGSVNCALTLQASSVRTSALLSNGVYGRNPTPDDDRFVDYFGSTDVVVTSGARNDSGLFETNLRDERFLPFEGAGAIGTWTLTLRGKARSLILASAATLTSASRPSGPSVTSSAVRDSFSDWYHSYWSWSWSRRPSCQPSLSKSWPPRLPSWSPRPPDWAMACEVSEVDRSRVIAGDVTTENRPTAARNFRRSESASPMS